MPISSIADIEARKQELLALPEDWYVDYDGSHATLPTSAAIDAACDAAIRGLSLGLMIDDIDADVNGGTCTILFNDNGMTASLYFGNNCGWYEALTESSWDKIKELMCG